MTFRALFAFVAISIASPSIADAAETASFAEIEALCPGAGIQKLTFGQTEAEQDKAMLKELKQSWPLGEGEAQFTSWSGRLYAIEWRKESPDGPTNQKWRMAIEQRLLADGWKPVSYSGLSSPQAMDSAMVEKRVGDRTLIIEYDTPGIQLLRCADLALLQINQRETEGELEPGTPRPPSPPVAAQPFSLPEPGICARPEMIAAFAGITQSTEIGPTLERLFPGEDPAQVQWEYQRRYNTWLKWKLRSEGKLNEEQIWDLDRSEAKTKASVDGTVALLEVMGTAFAALETRDGRKLCEASIGIRTKMHTDAVREAESHRKSNVPLEAEARRLSIKLD